MDRTKNVVNNIVFGVIQKIVMIVGPFWVRTALIYQLTSQIAGINDLFTSILLLLNLTELGLSNVIVYSMYKPIADNNYKTICSLLNFYRKAYLWVGGGLFIIGSAITPFITYLLKDNNSTNINVLFVYFVFLFNSSISYLFFSYKTCLLTANQRQDVISRNTTVVNVILYALQISSLLCLKNYYVYICLLPLSTILLNLFNYKCASNLFPNVKCEGKISKNEFKEIKKSLYGILIWKIGLLSRNSFDNIVITLYLSISLVAVYSNYMLLINAVTGFFGIVLSSMIASIGNKVASNSVKENYKDFCKFNLIYMLLSSWITICLLCLIQPFMYLWMGRDLVLSDSALFLICILFYLFRTGDINSAYYHATGLWHKGRYRSIIEAILNLILNLSLGYLFGIEGIILATIIAYCSVWFYSTGIVFKYYFKSFNVKSFYLQNFYYLFILTIVSGITYYTCDLIEYSNNKFSLIVDFLIRILVSLFSLILLVIFYKNLKYYTEAYNFVKTILNKFLLKRFV